MRGLLSVNQAGFPLEERMRDGGTGGTMERKKERKNEWKIIRLVVR